MMKIFQKNIKGGRDFKISVKQRYDEETKEYTSNEGMAILYFDDEEKMITIGGMSTTNIERAMKHIMRILINCYKDKNDTISGIQHDCITMLNNLVDIINNEVEANGSMDDFN